MNCPHCGGKVVVPKKSKEITLIHWDECHMGIQFFCECGCCLQMSYGGGTYLEAASIDLGAGQLITYNP
jgi:hypothetical protein